jgi:hypothetical protein
MEKHLIFMEVAKKYGNALCKEFMADNKAFILFKQGDGEFTFSDSPAHNEEKRLADYLLSNGLFPEDFTIK